MILDDFCFTEYKRVNQTKTTKAIARVRNNV